MTVCKHGYYKNCCVLCLEELHVKEILILRKRREYQRLYERKRRENRNVLVKPMKQIPSWQKKRQKKRRLKTVTLKRVLAHALS